MHFRQGCKVEWRYKEDGERVRVSCRTGRVIPIPQKNLETIDYKQPRFYVAQAKDTTAEDVKKVTFEVRRNIHVLYSRRLICLVFV